MCAALGIYRMKHQNKLEGDVTVFSTYSCTGAREKLLQNQDIESGQIVPPLNVVIIIISE